MKKTNSSGFTLIELLVVITIIAILASIALPAFTGVQVRANQTKDLANGKSIGISLKQFATDNNGSFPNKAPGADYAAATALAKGSAANDALWWLFPNYLTTEAIFAVPGSAWTPNVPDNKLDVQPAAARSQTLKSGENSYAYVLGLTDTSNSSFPLLADGFSTQIPKYAANKAVKGGVWEAKKAIVIFCDSSGQTMNVDRTLLSVKRPGSSLSIFEASADQTNDPWLDQTANPVLNPD